MSSATNLPERKAIHWVHGDGRPVAYVRFTPDELRSRNGMIFSRTYDDLDYLLFAAYSPSHQLIGDGNATPALLVFIRYDGDPGPGTGVYADVALTVEQAYDATCHLLNATDGDFIWVAEHEARDVARVGD